MTMITAHTVPRQSGYADLHLHSSYSDGSDSPAEVVRRAAELGFHTIAITDHDTVAGIAEAEAAAKEAGIRVVPAVEISCVFESHEIHVVGLGINPGFPPLVAALTYLRNNRTLRARKIVERLNTLGVPLDIGVMETQIATGSIGRIHIAREIHALGSSKNVQDSFQKYLRKGKPAYVSKINYGIEAAIDLIHQANGLAFLAHPGIGVTVERRLERLLRFPFDGIEVYHTHHTSGQVTLFTQVALEHDLLISGGSDCHGTARQPIPDMGKVRLPLSHVNRILEVFHQRLA